MEAHNERFQELVEDVLETIKLFEMEMVSYGSALQELKKSAPSSAYSFQLALEDAHHSHGIRKGLENKKRERLALFQGMPNVPIDPKMDALRLLLESLRKEISSLNNPSKDAQ